MTIEEVVHPKNVARQQLEGSHDQPQAALPYSRGKARGQAGNFEQAVADLRQALALKPNHGPSLNALGEILSRQEQHHLEALDCFRQALSLDPQSVVAYCNLAALLVQQQQWMAAIDAYESAIRLSPTCFPAQIGLARSLCQVQEWERAIPHFEKAIELRAHYYSAYVDLISAYLEKGEPDQAIQTYQDLLRLQPNVPILYCLAILFSEKQQWIEAIDVFLHLLEKNPNHVPALRHLEKILQQQQIYPTSGATGRPSKKVPMAIIQHYRPQVREWSTLAKADFAEYGIVCQDLYPTETVSLQQPLNGAPREMPHSYFAAGKRRTCEGYVACLQGGRAYADRLTSAVMTGSKQLLEDMSTGFSTIVPSFIESRPVYQLEGRVAFLSSRWGSRCYFHWILDVLPRIELIRQSGLELSELAGFVFYQSDVRFCQETLRRLDIPDSKIIDSAEHPYIQADRLIVPSIMHGLRGMKWVQQFLQNLLLDERHSIRSERIFISRLSAKGRRVINEAEVVEYLAAYGFRRVFAESLSVAEQAAVLNSAEGVIAPHGSGLTNLVFCQPGTKVVELFAPAYVNSCYWELSNLCGLDYFYLIGRAPESPDPPEPNGSHAGAQDMWIDCNVLGEILVLAGLG